MRRQTTWRAVAVLSTTLVIPAAAPLPPGGAGLAVTLTGAPPVAVVNARPTLRSGDRGTAVRDLQQRLRVAVDGRFGPVTLAAVRAFQRSKGLVVDGIVGPRTWQALDGGTLTPVSAPAPAGARPVLRLGSSGPAVAEAQKLLTDAGQRVAADGRFGPRTHAAVMAVQRARGLAADGVIGPATWSTLKVTAGVPLTLISTSRPEAWRTIGAKSYAVRTGDTLPSVAARTGSTATALAAANRIAPGSRLTVGSTLMVPGSWRCPVRGGGFINDYGFARVGHLHEGNDIFAIRGTPVVAPVGGRIERRTGGNGGNAVHLFGQDGHRYYFAHLDRFGATGRVDAGTMIGTVGNTGNAITTLPHLHFEIHPDGGLPVNPFPSLTLACKR